MKKILQFILLWLIVVAANGQIIGTTTYNLCDTTLVGDSTYHYENIVVDDDNEFTIYTGDAGYIKYHGTSYGMDVKVGNAFSFKLSGLATVTIPASKYSTETGYWLFTNESGDSIGYISDYSETDLEELTFSYSGTPQTITATCEGGQAYVPYVTIVNSETGSELDGAVQVWDFGAEQLTSNTDTTYVNMLNADSINGWYNDTITAGSAGYTLPDFTADELSWTGKSTSDRLRTTNTNLTRYDVNIGSNNTPYTGRIYVNGTALSTRYLTMSLLEDDEVTIAASSQNGIGVLNFVNTDGTQTDTTSLASDVALYKFVAKTTGTYEFYDTADKPSYMRVYRKNAVYVSVSGSVTAPSDIPEGYSIVYTNEAGKEWSDAPSDGSYSVTVPSGYSYDVSLADANGYVISEGGSVDVSSTTTNDITISAVALDSLSGSITGLSASALEELSIAYTATDSSSVYEPDMVINVSDSTYSVALEDNVEYTISADGVNDYVISDSSVILTSDSTLDIVFTSKPTYKVTLTSSDLTEDQLSQMTVTFSNLNEDGYDYEFTSLDSIYLRDASYSVTCSGLDSFTVEQDLTSNLVVDGESVSKAIYFSKVTDWTFADGENLSNATAYKGLLFSGSVTVRGASGDLYGASGATIAVPVSAGEKLKVSDYYSADYSVGDSTFTNTTSSTGSTYSHEIYYAGSEDTTFTITFNANSYLTEIEVLDTVAYSSVIYVGEDKEYTTINDALDAVSRMNRDGKRVTIEIDPGDYQEMLVIDQDSVTLANASESPSIALKNEGVDIDTTNTVRITSYYGYGYNYYSMDEDQKWHSDVLAVNKANGYASYDNQGGTTNGSYWNATVIVEADGFEAENIIFENSFNQYISTKEANDVVEATSNAPTTTARPTTAGSILVQDKDYVERAAAFAVASGDKTFLNNCRIVGHQDSFYGTKGSRVGIYKGVMMGGTDYIFGGMIAVFYQSDLALTTSDDSNDRAYITAAQQESGRGYLMYECNVVSATPGDDISSDYESSKPGYFGRPWAASTSEVVFYKTDIASCENSSYSGESLIEEAGWLSTLSGESPFMIEAATTEEAEDVDNSDSRVSWAQVLDDDATTFTGLDSETVTIEPYTFTKGEDGWDPFAIYVNSENGGDGTGIATPSESSVQVYAYKNNVVVKNVTSETLVKVYNLSGQIVKSLVINDSSTFTLPQGYFIVKVDDETGTKAVKVVTHY